MNIRTRIVKITAVVTLSGAILGIGSSAAMAADGDPSQWGKSSAVEEPSELHKRMNMEYEGELTRKVNEYEGQHRLTVDEDQSPSRRVNEYEGQHR